MRKKKKIYGIWLVNTGGWLRDREGFTWHTEYPELCEAQLKFGGPLSGPALAREIHNGGLPVSLLAKEIENFGEGVTLQEASARIMRQRWEQIQVLRSGGIPEVSS